MTDGPLRIGVLTCGAIVTKGHLPGFAAAGDRSVVDLVAFQSRTRATAEAARDQWGSGEVVDDWRDVLARADVDAVDICSPNALHATMAIAAAEAGKHVLVEKPMATKVADADAMVAAAEQAGVVLMAAHNLRFAAPYAAAARAVAEGLVGDVVGVRLAMGHGGPQAWTRDAGWFRDRELSGGGALVDLGIHMADLLRAVTGDDVAEVSAFVRRPSPDAVEESGQLAFTMRRGAVGSLSASWSVRPGADHHLTVHGTEGTLTVERGQAVVRPADGGEKVVVEPPSPAPDLLANFVAVCRGEAEAVVGPQDGREALAIIEAAYRSVDEGRSVRISTR
ncbi:MAG TPA: Gfo/Idh/MocA family oxidoreductase [Acidimicrobiales bacterium]|nr:Gfo/Idh/MocA family oxidoreductase [Acidimicrobiales bacterium]